MKIVATLDYIERKFDEFNKLIFNNSLPCPTFKLSSARTFLGQIRYTRKHKILSGWKYENFILTISNRISREESLLEDTIIHEMIHYYIFYNGIKDTSAHGIFFRKMMVDINERFNRNITITHRCSEEEKNQDTELRRHLLCISRLKDNRIGLTLACESNIFMLWEAILRFPEVLECNWYVTKNPYFNRFRRSIKPKIYLVDEKELELHIHDAIPLHQDGNIINLKLNR